MTQIEIEKLPTDLIVLCDIIGLENIKVLCEVYGGSSLYIPKSDMFVRHRRNLNIYEDYKKGSTYKTLSRKFNLSTVSIRNIIASFL